MEDYQYRVLIEKNDLDVKCRALRYFIGSAPYLALGEAEQALLQAQLSVMCNYSAILGERIKGFDVQPLLGQ